MYPKEVEVLIEKINERANEENDRELLNMIHAALAPHTKDMGQGMIKTISAKYKTLIDDDVTPESIAKDIAMARQMMRR